jgi:hypothetical protein
MDVCCECCVLSGTGLCDVLITRSEESYRLWWVVVCCQVVVSATGRSLVQRSPTDCGESLCVVRESSLRRADHSSRGVLPTVMRRCVLSGRGLCDGLITRPEESYRLWWVIVCCHIEVSATSWSLVQRNPTDCGASLCVI